MPFKRQGKKVDRPEAVNVRFENGKLIVIAGEERPDNIKLLEELVSERLPDYGKNYFNVEEGLRRKGLRELRKPEKKLRRKTA